MALLFVAYLERRQTGPRAWYEGGGKGEGQGETDVLTMGEEAGVLATELRMVIASDEVPTTYKCPIISYHIISYHR